MLEHELHPQPGYPFLLQLRITYVLATEGLTAHLSATNTGGAACPFGCGVHPYVTVGTDTVDDALLRIPAQTALRSDGRGIPVGTVDVDGTELDFRTPQRIGATKLDTGYTDLDRDESGRAAVAVSDGDGRGLALWMDESYEYVMVFTGDIPAVSRGGLAIEPMTCAPNAFRTGDGLVRLEPGESWSGTWGIDPR
jgi:aldose 1-epimerase